MVAVLSMMRAVLYRTMHSTLFRVYTVTMAVICLVLPLAIWLSQQPDLGLGNIIEGDLASLTLLQFYGSGYVSGSFLAMFAAVYVASFAAADFKTGYVKNLVQAQGGRVSYAVSLVAVALLATLWFMVVGIAVTAVSLPVVGQSYLMPTFADALLWVAQVLLVVSAYAAVALLVVAITKSEAAGIVAAIMLSGGVAEMALSLVLSNIPVLPMAVRTCLDGYLAADLAQLAVGMAPEANALVEGGLTLAVAAVLVAVVLRRRRLA